ncbi:MAG: MBL fold metallo-hydrolase [Clostridia bacterium]|nr:MBL fold metallo-hydrolase [Clostridia bacterium]
MKLITVNTPFMDVNTYLLESDMGAIIIDPAQMTDEIKLFIKENANKEIALLLTHSHFDHIMGAAEVKRLSGCKVYVGAADAEGLINPELNLSERFCINCEPVEGDCLLEDNDEITIGDIKAKVMHTPGHSKGSVCFIVGDWMFSGDTLFRMSVGRTDFIGGDKSEQNATLKRLCEINGDYDVYPGHGPATRLSFERTYNPYIKEIL